MPFFSVIIASYNHARCVRRQVESILGQTFQDFEVVAVDDGSTDRKADILEEYAPRVRVIRQENRGVVEARMRGIRETTGEAACFVDSDDCFVPAIAASFRRRFFEETGGFWGPGPLSDYLKWIEIAEVLRVVRQGEVLGAWRRHPGSVSLLADREKMYGDLVAALEELRGRWPALSARTGFASCERYARAWVAVGFGAARAGDFGKAREYFGRAVGTCPWMVHGWAGSLLSLPPASWVSRRVFGELHRLLFPWE